MTTKPTARRRHPISLPQKPRVLDLFAGCGGLSLGFHGAGYEIAAAVEHDSLAARSHAENFFRNASPEARAHHAKAVDITTTDPQDLLTDFGLKTRGKGIDVIAGGPPCQSFARVGRAKLREVYDHPQAFKLDPRKDLYLRFLTYVLDIRPSVILMENVPDVMNSGGHNVPEETCEILAENGYNCRYTLLNAAFYGVPEMRERMYLLGWLKDFGVPVTFPAPTHWIDLPIGYSGTRSVALRGLRSRGGQSTLSFIEGDEYYMPPPTPTRSLTAAITAEQAIGDLPPITMHLNGGLTRGARRFDTRVQYRGDIQPTPYMKAMRSWPGFENTEGIFDHVIRSLPRDYPIFRRMNPGDQYPEAYRHAEAMLEEEIQRRIRAGERIGKSRAAALRRQIVPPYDATKFPNKWRKMERDKPARTIMAHIGKDSYSHIHYDSEQARTISVREAARIQSFPDGFRFSGTMNPAFKQIGNAVPPLMAQALANHIKNALTERTRNGPQTCH